MKYMIERFGNISGKTFHNTLDEAFSQLEKEYPKQENITEGLADIVGSEKSKLVFKYLKDTLNIEQWLPDRQTPDPEDDRILIREVLDTGDMKVVWHFSGWHWVNDASDVVKDGLPQGTLPHDEDCLYKIACA